MAIYYLGMKTFSRSSGKRGSRATSGAAYRAGERIRDERTGAVYDHHRRRDVMHKEIVLPAQLAQAGRAMDWARNRATLWNAAERAEARRNSRVAREFVIALPHELSHEERTGLTKRFAQELADRYGNAVDIAIHAPRKDPRNFHAHLLATTREVTPDGLGPKTSLEISGTERHRRGLPRWMEETAAIRERWATLTNEALEKAHLAARVSPMSLEALRTQQAAARRLPVAAFRIEQRGGHSFVAERIRAGERSVLERAERNPSERARTERESQIEARHPGQKTSHLATTFVRELWRQARESWGALRDKFAAGAVTGVSAGRLGAEPQGLGDEHPSSREGVTTREIASPPRPAPEGIWHNEHAEEAAREWLRRREAGLSGNSRLETGRALAPERAKTHEHDYGLDL